VSIAAETWPIYVTVAVACFVVVVAVIVARAFKEDRARQQLDRALDEYNRPFAEAVHPGMRVRHIMGATGVALHSDVEGACITVRFDRSGAAFTYPASWIRPDLAGRGE
jgi:hypothetical protein